VNKIELQKEMQMSYEELVKYLQEKYGLPHRAYFRTETCKTKSDITRGREGLFIHHVKETEIDDLSQTARAANYPWEYQLPHNLCYCNYLEHLWLHILINKLRCDRNGAFVSDGILHHFVPTINSIYQHPTVYTSAQTQWRNVANSLIAENEEEYCQMLSLWLNMIEEYNNFSWLTLPKLLDGSV
jgi:hypothetical protein